MLVRYAAGKLGRPWVEGVQGKISKADIQEAVKGLRVKLMGVADLDRNDPVGAIQAEAEAMKAVQGIAPFIAVDYMQLLARGVEDKKNAMGELSMRLRALAQMLDTVVLAVFSTGRGFYGPQIEKLRQFNDPLVYMGAAKESGDIEYDCANILFLDVDQTREGQPKPARIAVARSRYGTIGLVGARARLDIGTWHGDPSAGADMTTEAKSARTGQDRNTSDGNRVLEIVKKMVGRPWRDMKLATGLGSARSDAARAKLIEDGKIEEIRETYVDANKRHRTRLVMAVRNNPPAEDVAEKESEP
jgi:hypothetical protein